MTNFINKLVVGCSEAETRGCLLYTRCVLLAYEEARWVPNAMFKQSFISACLRSVTSKAPIKYDVDSHAKAYLTRCQPTVSPVTSFDFKGFTGTLEVLARRMLTCIHNNVWMHMEGRQYRVLKRHVEKALTVHLGAEKTAITPSVITYLVKWLRWRISGATKTDRRPDPDRYDDDLVRSVGVDLASKPWLRCIADQHRLWILDRDLTIDPVYGIFTKKNMIEHTDSFFTYMVFLEENLPKGFALIPQYTMKRRSVMMEKRVLAESMRFICTNDEHKEALNDLAPLLSRVVSRKEVIRQSMDRKVATIESARRRVGDSIKKYDTAWADPKKGKEAVERCQLAVFDALKREDDLLVELDLLKSKFDKANDNPTVSLRKVSREKWEAIFLDVVKHVYQVPKKITKTGWTFTGVVTTNGVIASWHQERTIIVPKTEENASTSKSPTIIRATDLRPIKHNEKPRSYGTHGKDCLIDQRQGEPLNKIGIDVGREIVLAAVRKHEGVSLHQPPPPGEYVSKSSKRRHALARRLAEKNKSHFLLTNKQWQHMCGRVEMASKERNLRRKLGIQSAYNLLSIAPGKTSDLSEYDAHIYVVEETMDAMIHRARIKSPSRWKFDCRKKEGLAAKKLSQDLLSGCVGNSVVIWANGGFAPSGKGHAPAPNKRLRRLLSKYLHIVVSSEYRSSQICCCCHEALVDGPRKSKGRRVVVKHCKKCKATVARDLSAASVIIDIFEWQRLHRTDDLPPFVKKTKAKRKRRATRTVPTKKRRRTTNNTTSVNTIRR